MSKKKNISKRPSWEISWKKDLQKTIRTPEGVSLASSLVFALAGGISIASLMKNAEFNTLNVVTGVLAVASLVPIIACHFWKEHKDYKSRIASKPVISKKLAEPAA